MYRNRGATEGPLEEKGVDRNKRARRKEGRELIGDTRSGEFQGKEGNPRRLMGRGSGKKILTNNTERCLT